MNTLMDALRASSYGATPGYGSSQGYGTMPSFGNMINPEAPVQGHISQPQMSWSTYLDMFGAPPQPPLEQQGFSPFYG